MFFLDKESFLLRKSRISVQSWSTAYTFWYHVVGFRFPTFCVNLDHMTSLGQPHWLCPLPEGVVVADLTQVTRMLVGE